MKTQEKTKMGYSSMLISRISSFIHALFVSTCSLIIFFTREWNILLGPLYSYDSLWCLMFKTTSCYLAGDIILMLLMPSKGDRTWIIHHIIGGIGIFLIWKREKVWLLGLFFELTEISTIFLNITWVHVKTNHTKAISFKFFGILLLLSFFIIRIIGGFVMFYYLHYYWDIIITWDYIDIYYISLGSIVMFMLNAYWFKKLLAKIIKQQK